MRTTLALLATLTACGGMARAYGTDPALPSTITVDLALHPDAAESHAFARAVRAGFTVTDRRAGVLTVGPYALPSDAGVKLQLTANIIAKGSDSSTVVVSGVVISDARMEAVGARLAGRQGEAQMRGTPIRQATAGHAVANWKELERFAAAIRP